MVPCLPFLSPPPFSPLPLARPIWFFMFLARKRAVYVPVIPSRTPASRHSLALSHTLLPPPPSRHFPSLPPSAPLLFSCLPTCLAVARWHGRKHTQRGINTVSERNALYLYECQLCLRLSFLRPFPLFSFLLFSPLCVCCCCFLLCRYCLLVSSCRYFLFDPLSFFGHRSFSVAWPCCPRLPFARPSLFRGGTAAGCDLCAFRVHCRASR